MSSLGSVVSSTTPNGRLIDSDGKATFPFIKWMQGVGATVNGAFDAAGNYQGPIGAQATINGRATLASIVSRIDTDGVVLASGIDFSRAYINKDTDHIDDGTGSPLAGGKVAFSALVASIPTAGQTIRFNGTNWLPVFIALTQAAAPSRWLNSYNAATGVFTASQPAFSDISGAATSAQLPADIAYKSQPNTFTQPQTVNSTFLATGSAYLATDVLVGASAINTANSTRISLSGGVCFVDTFGPDPSTQGEVFVRTVTSDGSSTNAPVHITPGGLAVTGNLSATGAKSFRVPHPLDDTKDLWHACLEGPENGVYYRGEVKTENGSAEVVLPDYFEALTYAEDRSVQLTQVFEGEFSMLASSRVVDGKFQIRSSESSAIVAWEVKAVRRIGVDRLQVEQEKV
jgi:hypothetical protein